MTGSARDNDAIAAPAAQAQAAAAPPAPDESGAESAEPFDAPVRSEPRDGLDIDALIVNLDGYEGPLDVLLDLARAQKVDLRKISMLALVEQYLRFVVAAKARRLELAADYLVMAAWLAFLKSKLLLPAPEKTDEEPGADELAAQLAFQLQRLEAMRSAAEALWKLPKTRVDVFPRGMAEGVRVKRVFEWRAEMFDLLKAYAKQRVAAVDRSYVPEPPRVFQIEEARARLQRILGDIPDWVELRELLSPAEVDAPPASVIASAFNAALEFAKHGAIELRQASAFEPIYIRRRNIAAIPSEETPPADIAAGS